MFKHLLAIGFLGLFAAAVAKSNKSVRRRETVADPIAEFRAKMAMELFAISETPHEPLPGLVRRDATYHTPYGLN